LAFIIPQFYNLLIARTQTNLACLPLCSFVAQLQEELLLSETVQHGDHPVGLNNGAIAAGGCKHSLTNSLAWLVAHELLTMVPQLLKVEKSIPQDTSLTRHHSTVPHKELGWISHVPRTNTGTAATGGWEDGLTEALAQLVAQELLPMVPELLREEKPIPVWALKVVEECLESLPDTTIPALERYA